MGCLWLLGLFTSVSVVSVLLAIPHPQVIASTVWSEGWLQSIRAFKIPDWAIGDDVLKAFCENGIAALESVNPPSFLRGSTKTEQKDCLKLEREASNRSEVRTVSVFVKRPLEANNMEKSAEPRNKCSKPNQQETDPISKKEQEENSEPQGDKKDSEDENVGTLVQAAHDMLHQRAQNREIRDREMAVKSLLKRKGLDFNRHFQPEHKGMGSTGGHWKAFLHGIAGRGNIECEICQRLINRFRIDAFDTGNGNEDPQVDLQDPESWKIVPCPKVEATPPKKRSRAGRPRKCESVEFNLLDYLASKRPNMYRPLTEAEAGARLAPRKKADPQALQAEMAKRPVQCRLCGVYLHFPHLSNNNALILGICASCFLFSS